jgi:hypothetical protein
VVSKLRPLCEVSKLRSFNMPVSRLAFTIPIRQAFPPSKPLYRRLFSAAP